MLVQASVNLAQAVTGGAATEGHPVVDTLITQLIPYIVAAVGLVITALGTLLVTVINRLGKKWNVEIDATQAAKLNQALTNAAGGLIQKLGPEIAMKLAPGHPDVQAYAQRVSNGLADALKDLKVDPATVPQRILEKVPQVLPVDGTAAAVAAPIPKPG